MLAGLLSLFMAFAHAEEERFAGFAPAFSFDYIGTGNLASVHRRETETACRELLASGAATCQSEASARGAIGGRGGLFYRTNDFAVGVSIGAYNGGPTAGDAKVTVTPAGLIQTRVRNTMVRFLLENPVRFSLGENRAVLLSAGGGVAMVEERESCAATGTLANECGLDRTFRRGFATWEAGPALLIGPVEIAVRWVGFARRRLRPWNTWGVSVGLKL